MSKGRHQQSTKSKMLSSMSKKQLTIIIASLGAVAAVILCVVLIVRGISNRSELPDIPGADDQLQSGDDLTGDATVDPGVVTDPGTVQDKVEDPASDPGTEPDGDPVYTGPVNPLTGEPLASSIDNIRPYAVMLNNIRAAVPQAGISKADIIYEVPVEGGITRLLALYTDLTAAEAIGSVRSARPYFLDLAQGYDAIFIHAGASNAAYLEIRNRGIDNIDGVNGSGETFYRDSWRRSNMGYEHSLMLDPSLVADYVEQHSFRTRHEDGFTYGLKFSDTKPDSAILGQTVTAAFSSTKSTTFAYSETDGLYYVSQFGTGMKDSETDEQLTVKNVLILKASISQITGDEEGRLNVKLTGSGSGYLVRDGVSVEITWSKSSAEDQFSFTYTDGSAAELGRGTTYIAIVPTGSDNVDFS